MKLRRLLAASAAVAVAAAATVTSFATTYWAPGDSNNSGLVACLKSDNGTPTLLEDTSLAYDVTKVIFTARTDSYKDVKACIKDGTWIGGALCLCSPSYGWKQIEWTFDGTKDITVVEGDKRDEFVLEFDNGAPIFAETDTYCQIHIHDWSGLYEFEIVDIQLLNADGVDVREAAAATPDEPVVEEPVVETEEPVVETEEPAVETEEPAEDETTEDVEIEISEDDAWAAYDADAMAAMNQDFQLGVTDQIDIYDLVGDDWVNLAKVEGTFVWTPGLGGWCGGGGIGGGAVLADGSDWLSGPEYGAANGNAAVEPDGTATQTIIDITENPIENLVTYDAETGEFSFGKIFVQNWWNGVEVGAQVAAITAYDADGNVIGELTYDVAVPEAPEADDPAVDTDAPTEDNKGGSPDTGVEGIAVAAGIVALAGAAVVASRKRK